MIPSAYLRPLINCQNRRLMKPLEIQSRERDPGQAHEFSSGFLSKSRELPAVVPNKESRDHKKNEAVIEASDLQRLLSQQQGKNSPLLVLWPRKARNAEKRSYLL